MKEICPHHGCTGCCMCYNVCPANAITMSSNSPDGFVPAIDPGACTGCGLCAKLCPQNNELPAREPRTVYAAWAKDREEQTSSSSGGMASVLYDCFIKEFGGVCAGTAFGEQLSVDYVLFQNAEDKYRCKGSKYVQSFPGAVYAGVRDCLTRDKSVLFIGTPCHVAGLKAFLGHEYARLFTVDLVCHGVPPARYLREHFGKYLRRDSKMIAGFRAGNHYRLTVSIYNETKTLKNDIYLTAFLGGLTYRESCYACKYAKRQRISDMTIGDYWGLPKNIAALPGAGDGVSVVLVNTEKGGRLFHLCEKALIFHETSLSEACAENGQLNHPTVPHRRRKVFLWWYKRLGFDRACFMALFDILYAQMIKRVTRKCLRVVAPRVHGHFEKTKNREVK